MKFVEGDFENKIKTYKFPSKNESMYEVSSKSDNGQIYGENFRGANFVGGQGNLEGGISRKKMKTYKFSSKNESMYEVSSKSETGQI